MVLSVVIPHYGSSEPTLELIASLKSQQNVELQIIVADDASPEKFPETNGIDIIRRSQNGGFGSAVNSGVERAVGDYALILNSDLQIGPAFVADLLAAAEPWQPAVVSPQVVGHNGHSQWVGRHFPTAFHQAVEWLSSLARFRHLKAFHEGVGHDTRCVDGAVVPVDWVFGAAMLIPLAQFREVGGFDEGFFMNSEEVDLQRRLKAIGVPAVFAGTIQVTHEGGRSSDPTLRRQWLVDSRLRYARKWGGEPWLKASLRCASGVNFLVNCTRQLLGRNIDAAATLHRELSYLKDNKQ